MVSSTCRLPQLFYLQPLARRVTHTLTRVKKNPAKSGQFLFHNFSSDASQLEKLFNKSIKEPLRRIRIQFVLTFKRAVYLYLKTHARSYLIRCEYKLTNAYINSSSYSSQLKREIQQYFAKISSNLQNPYGEFCCSLLLCLNF